MENRRNNNRRDGGNEFKKNNGFKDRNGYGQGAIKPSAKPYRRESFDDDSAYDSNWFDIEVGESKPFAPRTQYAEGRTKRKSDARPFAQKDRKYNSDKPAGRKTSSDEKHGRDYWSSDDRFDRKERRGGNKDRYDSRKYNNRYNDYDEDEDMSFYERKVKTRRPRIASKPSQPKKEDGTVRLNKYIANAGICSRREADVLIASGAISVNGEVITQMGYKVKPDDVVNYGGERLVSEKKRYVLLNKPKGYITTSDDPQERKTVMMLVENACTERIYPVGRLDRNTTGVLLFTNDGDMAKKLTHPSTGARKIYHVELDKNLTHADMQRMVDGIMLEDGEIAVDDVQYVGNGEHKNIVGVVLHSGRNRIVRRIFEAMGYEVCKLDRVVFAGLTKKDLPRGHWRLLTEKEVSFLKML